MARAIPGAELNSQLLQIDEDLSEDSGHHPADPKCQIIICLAQEHRRSTREKKVSDDDWIIDHELSSSDEDAADRILYLPS